MSASREKKKRFEERSDGTEKRQVRAKEDFKRAKRKKLITAIAVVVVVVLVVFGIVFNSNLFYTGVTAVKAGPDRYTAADFNYEYFNTYYNTYTSLANSYGEYVSMFLDPSQPLCKQQYSEDMTWEQYFETQAFTQLQQMSILNHAADDEGWELSADQKSEISAQIDSLKTAAASNGYSDYRTYIRALYGKGFTEAKLRSLLEKSYRASYYSQYLTAKWKDSYTDGELDAFYDTVRTEYDPISFMAYTVNAVKDEENGIDEETAKAQAKEIAEQLLAARDKATFADAVYRFAPEDDKSKYEDEDACFHRYTAPSGIANEEWRTWLTDPARQAGDTTIVEFSTGCHVLLYLDRSDNAYEVANYRGITVTVEKDEESGEITEATRAAAQEKVDAILEYYEEDPTQDNFAALADKYDESGEDVDGGLHENVVLGQLASEEAEEFVFSGAEPGTVKTIYEDGRFYILCAMESGERYDRYIAENRKASEQFTSMMEAGQAQFPVTTGFAFGFTK